MGWRLLLMGLVAGLGIELPTWQEIEAWGHSGQVWLCGQLDHWSPTWPADAPICVAEAEMAGAQQAATNDARIADAAESRAVTTDADFSAVVDEIVAQFEAAQNAICGELPRTVVAITQTAAQDEMQKPSTLDSRAVEEIQESGWAEFLILNGDVSEKSSDLSAQHSEALPLEAQPIAVADSKAATASAPSESAPALSITAPAPVVAATGTSAAVETPAPASMIDATEPAPELTVPAPVSPIASAQPALEVPAEEPAPLVAPVVASQPAPERDATSTKPADTLPMPPSKPPAETADPTIGRHRLATAIRLTGEALEAWATVIEGQTVISIRP